MRKFSFRPALTMRGRKAAPSPTSTGSTWKPLATARCGIPSEVDVFPGDKG